MSLLFHCKELYGSPGLEPVITDLSRIIVAIPTSVPPVIVTPPPTKLILLTLPTKFAAFAPV